MPRIATCPHCATKLNVPDEVGALRVSGSQPSLRDATAFSPAEMDAPFRPASKRGAGPAHVSPGRSGEVRVMVLFNAPPPPGGRALYLEFPEKSGNNRR